MPQRVVVKEWLEDCVSLSILQKEGLNHGRASWQPWNCALITKQKCFTSVSLKGTYRGQVLFNRLICASLKDFCTIWVMMLMKVYIRCLVLHCVQDCRSSVCCVSAAFFNVIYRVQLGLNAAVHRWLLLSVQVVQFFLVLNFERIARIPGAVRVLHVCSKPVSNVLISVDCATLYIQFKGISGPLFGLRAFNFSWVMIRVSILNVKIFVAHSTLICEYRIADAFITSASRILQPETDC